uniref:Uncharacterized protein n=1 Tax=Solanum lycopersicum TaxID=4081 RepID=A0A3Q7ERM0_SOLLC
MASRQCRSAKRQNVHQERSKKRDEILEGPLVVYAERCELKSLWVWPATARCVCHPCLTCKYSRVCARFSFPLAPSD